LKSEKSVVGFSRAVLLFGCGTCTPGRNSAGESRQMSELRGACSAKSHGSCHAKVRTTSGTYTEQLHHYTLAKHVDSPSAASSHTRVCMSHRQRATVDKCE